MTVAFTFSRAKSAVTLLNGTISTEVVRIMHCASPFQFMISCNPDCGKALGYFQYTNKHLPLAFMACFHQSRKLAGILLIITKVPSRKGFIRRADFHRGNGDRLSKKKSLEPSLKAHRSLALSRRPRADGDCPRGGAAGQGQKSNPMCVVYRKFNSIHIGFCPPGVRCSNQWAWSVPTSAHCKPFPIRCQVRTLRHCTAGHSRQI